MNVAFMTHSFPKITETFILNQIAGLLDRDQEVTVFAEKKPDTEATHELVSKYRMSERTVYTADPKSYIDGIQALSSSFPRLVLDDSIPTGAVLSECMEGKSAPRRMKNLQTVAERGQFDVYHAHFGTVGNTFLGITKCREAPYVVSFYGWDASQMLQNNPDYYDTLFERADAITVLSEDMRSTLVEAGCPRSKTHIQPLCIDTRQFSYQPRTLDDGEQIRLLTVARLVEKKGIEYALKAVADLTETYNIKYTIAGDGERRDYIESLIQDLELEETVDLLGWQSQEKIVELMTTSHVFVLPSVTAESGDKEGTPTVLLEAQAMGMPVVSTSHAGIPEIVGDGESGLLVPEKDSEALANALETIIDDPNQWQEFGKSGREKVEESHSIEAVSIDLLELYRSLQ